MIDPLGKVMSIILQTKQSSEQRLMSKVRNLPDSFRVSNISYFA